MASSPSADLPFSTADHPFAVRPLVPTDAGAVTRVMAAEELAVLGEVVIEEADIVSEWQRPSFDLARQTIGVFDTSDALVAYAEHSGLDRGDVAVHPDHHGRGIGTWLSGWLRDTARAAGSQVIGSPVPEGSPADLLLEDLGYFIRWTSWVLALPEQAAIAERRLPPGFEVRAAADHERPLAHDVLEDAFLEWSERDREDYADFEAMVLNRPGATPDLLRVVVAPDGSIGGVSVVILSQVEGQPLTGYVDRLAVRADLRNQGLALALLSDSFAVARSLGALRSELATDSRTGALDLYRRAGMEVTSTWVNRATRL